MKKNLLPILTFTRIDIKRLFRDKVAIFFVFLFPLIFLFVFGGIFGRNSAPSFNVALINESNSEFAKQFVEEAKKDEALSVKEDITNQEMMKDRMSKGELDAAIVLPEPFGHVQPGQPYPSGEMKILYDQSNEQAGQMLTSFIEGKILSGINEGMVKSEKPFTVKMESISTPGLSSFDYVFSGLLGFSMMSLGIFGPTSVFPKLKQRGVLRRYHTTPLKVWQYFTGNVLSNVFVGLLAVASMFLVAMFFPTFDLHMRGNYFYLAVITILGTVLMFGIGLAVGGWAKNENQAAPLAQLVTFPMMFLSGVFFPRFLMPTWLQGISDYLPLTPIVDSIRLVMAEGKSLLDLGPQMAIIGAWIVIIYIVAFKIFRWE